MLRRVSIKEIAEKTNVSPSTIRNWCDEGVLEHKKTFRGWRWFEDLDKTVKRVKALLYGQPKEEAVCKKT